MTQEENIKAILNAHFVGFKDEIIDSATNTICELKQEPFMNKPCVSAGVCEHDKIQVLDKIRAEIDRCGSIMVAYAITKDTRTDKGIEDLVKGVVQQAKEQVLEIIDKYRNGE